MMYPHLLPIATVWALAHPALSAATPPPTVFVANGTITGGFCDTALAVFYRSIPFALPPIGDLRFAPPHPYNQNFGNGSLTAIEQAPACIQFGSVFVENLPNSEDCLFLDIWAPANATNTSSLPVRAWIYGGSNTAGGISDPLYDGCNVAAGGAVMVSISYRVGPLGFLALKSAGIAGNQAVQDILLGLQWIQENIAAFGGNPKQVVLQGQSAGAGNTFVVSSLPQALSLIQAAIMESGGGQDYPSNSTAQLLGASYTSALNCSTADISCLRNASVIELRAAFNDTPVLVTDEPLNAVGVSNISTFAFASYVDEDIVPVQPSQQGSRVPAIFGSTSQDGFLFSLLQFADLPNGPQTANATDYQLFLDESFGSDAGLVEQFFPLSAFNSTPGPAFFAISTVLTLAAERCRVFRGMNATAAHGVPVYAYIFGHSPTCSWIQGLPDESLPLIGATHTSEIPFVMNNTKNLPAPNGNCSMTEQEVDIATFLTNAWTSMAINQKPTLNVSQWPAWGLDTSLGLNITNTSVAGFLNFSACQLFDSINTMAIAAAQNDSANSTSGSSNGTSSGSGGTGSSSNGTSSGSSPSSSSSSAVELLVTPDLISLAMVATIISIGSSWLL
ncbi:alpha/beta-hydrolase [Sistotremastrum niveocremeum HHB9708]|uniref:Carboxylic ester hydrolase n=1 Tax=Sistotremastrum niveocremeum HHB9708 TaxID=1314777 RepID=A0A164YTJ2_9AGAM|nr:alpha/beta-hydrolase [Sistotremastrum niveocremeum HHB9708]